MNPAKSIMGDVQRKIAASFSSFFEKHTDRRLKRFMKVRIVKLFRSTCDVQMDYRSMATQHWISICVLQPEWTRTCLPLLWP
jgi:hypothetical protein